MNIFYDKEERNEDVLLFLHGWGCDGNVFAPICRRLRQTCVTIDLWGFGKSKLPQKPMTVEDYADELKKFCDEIGLEKICLVAHSFGARIAVVFAAKYPEKVRGAVLTGAAGLKRFSAKRSLAVLRYKALKMMKKRGLFRGDLPRGSADYAALSSDVMRRTFVLTVRQDLSRYAKKVQCPTLLFWGDSDSETPLWMGRKYARLVKNSSLCTVQGDHFAFLQNAARFAAAVEVFVERLP